MSSIIVAAPPLSGETTPLLQIARDLVGRGHSVTVLAGSRFAEAAAETGATFVALSGAADWDDRRITEVFPEIAHTEPGVPRLNHDFAHVFGDAMAEQHFALQRLLEDEPDQVLVSNSLFVGMWPVALGAPGRRPARWIAVGCNPVALPSADTTPFGPLPGLTGEQARVAHLAANAEFQAALEPSREHLEGLVRGLGGRAEVPGFFVGIYTLPDAFVLLSVPGFEFERSDAPASFELIGPMAAPAHPEWLPPTWWPELEAGRPVVVVTQGTLANNSLGDLIEPTLQALSGLDVLVVAALGRSTDALSIAVPSNARVEEYIPFDELLPHASVFITNGGLGGTQRALASGVPVVVAGVTEDKALVAARVAANGLGVDLATDTPTIEAITDAFTTVLGDAAFRERCTQIATVYARYDASDTLAAMVS